MKNTSVFFLLIILLSSCSSFSSMKYRHLHKVPAAPQDFSFYAEQPVEERQPPCEPKSEIEARIPDTVFAATESCDSLTQAPVIHESGTTQPASQIETYTQERMQPAPSIRHDYSLLLAVIFIFGGILALVLCVFYFPFFGFSFWWTIAFELLSLYAAWRLLGTGITYFVTRFRRKTTYKED